MGQPYRKAYDGFTIGSVGNASKVDFCKKEGYDAVIVRAKDFGEKLAMELGERELRIVMGMYRRENSHRSFDAMAPMSRMIVYGSARYASPGNRPNYLKLIGKYLTRPKMTPRT